MVWIPSGTFSMGSNDAMFADAQPIHKVSLKGFFIDEHEVIKSIQKINYYVERRKQSIKTQF